MQLLMKPVVQIKPNPKNARTHSKKQIHQIVASIQAFGFQNPLLVDEAGMVIAGHGRLAAAVELKMAEIPVIEVSGLSIAQKRALSIADNRIALNAGWDLDILAVELRELSTMDLDFDIGVTGFETAEVDLLIDRPENQIADQRDNQLPKVNSQAVSHRGDLWLLDDHRLLCGDARDPNDYAALMVSDRARLMFADPPYNVKIDGHVGGLGSIHHREFATASGEMSETEFPLKSLPTARDFEILGNRGSSRECVVGPPGLEPGTRPL